MKSFKNVLTGLVLVGITAMCIVFLLQNGDLVRVNLFHLSTPEKPLWMFVLGAFFAGIFITSIFSLFLSLRYSNRLRRQRKEMEVLQKELHGLRNQPIEDVPQDENVEVATLVEDKDES